MIFRMPRLNRPAILLLIGLLFLASNASAAPVATVDAKLNPSSLKAGDKTELSVNVDVPEGYHAQSHAPLEKFYIPLTVKLDPNPAITVGDAAYPEGVIENYP